MEVNYKKNPNKVFIKLKYLCLHPSSYLSAMLSLSKFRESLEKPLDSALP